MNLSKQNEMLIEILNILASSPNSTVKETWSTQSLTKILVYSYNFLTLFFFNYYIIRGVYPSSFNLAKSIFERLFIFSLRNQTNRVVSLK